MASHSALVPPADSPLETLVIAGRAPVPPTRSGFPDIPGFTILAELGRGGMAVVYRAYQRTLNREVALKTIAPNVREDVEAQARFLREIESAAQLKHPNIVPVYEAGLAGDQFYYTMELVAGGDLEAHIKDQPQPPRESAELVALLAGAVQHAHDQGLIHRDLKPSNVLLHPTGPSATGSTVPTPRIADFGLARSIATQQALTSVGDVLGTPCYMAPEQASGQPVGTAVDIWALGVILYELLTGRPPHLAPTPAETMRLVLFEEVPSPRLLQPGVPIDLETICLKCLQKDPRQRYGTARELAEDLQRFLAGEAIRARPLSSLEQVGRWARKRPLVVGLLAALVVTVTAGFLGVFWKWSEAEQARQDAEQSHSHARQAAELEKQARIEADQARAGENLQRRQMSETFARFTLNQALDHCRQGDIDLGYLWLARALEPAIASGSVELEQAVRKQLAVWRPMLHRLENTIHANGPINQCILHDDGKKLTALVSDRSWVGQTMLYTWDARSGQLLTPRGPGLQTPGIQWLANPAGPGIVLGGVADLQFRSWPERPPLVRVGRTSHGAVSSDSKLLALVTENAPVRCYDLTTGKLLGESAPVSGQVHAAAFQPQGSLLVIAQGVIPRSREILFLDGMTGKQKSPPLKLGRIPRSVAFRPDGQMLAVGYHEGGFQFFQPDGRAVGLMEERHGHVVEGIAWHREGQLLATASQDCTARLWHYGEKVRPFGAPLRHPDGVRNVWFDPNEERVLTVGREGTLRFWRPGMSNPVTSVLHPAAPGWRCLLSADGQYYARVSDVAGASRSQVYTTASGTPTGAAWDETLAGDAVVFSPDNQFLVTTALLPNSQGREFRLRSATTGEPSGEAIHSRGNTIVPSFSPDSQRVVLSRGENTLTILEVVTGKPLAELALGDGPSFAVWSPDGQSIVTARIGGGLVCWDATTGKPRWDNRQAQRAYQARWTPDGKAIISTHHDRTLRMVDAAGGAWIGSPGTHSMPVTQLALHPRGDEVLVGTDDPTSRGLRETRRWRITPTGLEAVHSPVTHAGNIGAVFYSPRGDHFAIRTGTSQISLWDTATDRPLGPPLLLPPAATNLRFSPDGRELLIAQPNLGVVRWAVPEPLAGSSEAVREWAEVTLGAALDGAGGITILDPATWAKRRENAKNQAEK